ncbi:hypothetical protein LTR86_010797 [Recurvomyces mirabilis]|nr:hypothetical protein LTR86_010797 [Recurvomyces mirabilis]
MGSIAPPLIRLERLGFVIYEHPDLDAFRSYAKDFGLEEASSSSNEVFFAGYGRDPLVYIARATDPGSGNAFGCHGAQQVNTANRPGGGQAVSTTDLNGFVVEVCWGQKEKKLPRHGVSSVVQGGVVNVSLNKARVFDYWYDSSRFIIEHYADGDVVNDELPTAKFEAGHIAVWGPPVPAVWGGKTPVAKATA